MGRRMAVSWSRPTVSLPTYSLKRVKVGSVTLVRCCYWAVLARSEPLVLWAEVMQFGIVFLEHFSFPPSLGAVKL